MEEELAKPDDLQHLEPEINDVAEQHLLDLEQMYTLHAEEYYDECVDRYLSKDDTQILVEGESNATALESYARLEVRIALLEQIFTHLNTAPLQELYESTRTPLDLTSLWDDDYLLMRHTHFRRLHSLYKKRAELEAAQRQQEAQDEEARKRWEAQFPVSIEDFKAKSKDVQHRAARFLVLADGTRQEKMLAEYGWVWRQVKPLQEEMAKNVRFILCLFFSFYHLARSRSDGYPTE